MMNIIINKLFHLSKLPRWEMVREWTRARDCLLD